MDALAKSISTMQLSWKNPNILAFGYTLNWKTSYFATPSRLRLRYTSLHFAYCANLCYLISNHCYNYTQYKHVNLNIILLYSIKLACLVVALLSGYQVKAYDMRNETKKERKRFGKSRNWKWWSLQQWYTSTKLFKQILTHTKIPT